MAKNRKNQTAAVHFGPVIKVVLLCFLFGGSAVGYVWEKNEIVQLGRQISAREKRLDQLKNDNDRLSGQIAILYSPVMLDQRARELKLGLTPAQPMQVVRLNEVSPSQNGMQSRQLAGRPVVDLAQ